MHKSLSLYKEKRFTRLGYQSGAVYDCIPYLRKLLDETPLNNLLVRACKVYLENEFVLSGLKCLAIFTYKITMPFLNMVEKSDQNKLCELLPLVWETSEPSVKKFKKRASRRKLVLLGLKNHQKKVSIANRWGKISTAH